VYVSIFDIIEASTATLVIYPHTQRRSVSQKTFSIYNERHWNNDNSLFLSLIRHVKNKTAFVFRCLHGFVNNQLYFLYDVLFQVDHPFIWLVNLSSLLCGKRRFFQIAIFCIHPIFSTTQLEFACN